MKFYESTEQKRLCILCGCYLDPDSDSDMCDCCIDELCDSDPREEVDR